MGYDGSVTWEIIFKVKREKNTMCCTRNLPRGTLCGPQSPSDPFKLGGVKVMENGTHLVHHLILILSWTFQMQGLFFTHISPMGRAASVLYLVFRCDSQKREARKAILLLQQPLSW